MSAILQDLFWEVSDSIRNRFCFADCPESRDYFGVYTYGEEPDVVNVAHGLVTGQLDAPLAAVLVGRILPHGLDALLEQVVVGADGQITSLHDIVVNTIRE